MLNTNKIKKRIKAAVHAWQSVDQVEKKPLTEDQEKKLLEEQLKEYKKDLKLDVAKKNLWRKVKQEEINEMIETGFLSLDSLYNACLESEGSGFKSGEVRYKNGWIEAEKLQKAYNI